MFKASIFTLGVFPDDDNIYIVVACRQPLQIEAMDARGVEIKLLPELNVEGADTSTDGSLQPTLEADLIVADGVNHLRRHALHVAVDFVALKMNGSAHSLKDLLDGTGNKRTDAIARYKGDGAIGASFSGMLGHVGERSAAPAKEERVKGIGSVA